MLLTAFTAGAWGYLGAENAQNGKNTKALLQLYFEGDMTRWASYEMGSTDLIRKSPWFGDVFVSG